MEAVKVQDIAVDDLPWTIEYHAERCTLCGSCLASCTFSAIKPAVRRQSVTVSEGNQPKPAQTKWTFVSVTPGGRTNSASNSGAGSSSYQSAPLRSGCPSPIQGNAASGD